MFAHGQWMDAGIQGEHGTRPFRQAGMPKIRISIIVHLVSKKAYLII